MMAFDPSLNHWEPGIEMLKVHYGETSPLIKDRSQDPWVSGQVLWGPVIPAPTVITSLLLALYSMLTIYCVLLCMSVMHDALGDGYIPLEARNISSLFTVSYLV